MGWRHPLLLLVAEEVLIDLHDLDGAGDLHTHSMLDHELGQAQPVNEGDVLWNPLCGIPRLAAELARREEHSDVGAARRERSNETLHSGAANHVLFGIPLRLHVNLADAQFVAIDLAIEATIA